MCESFYTWAIARAREITRASYFLRKGLYIVHAVHINTVHIGESCSWKCHFYLLQDAPFLYGLGIVYFHFNAYQWYVAVFLHEFINYIMQCRIKRMHNHAAMGHVIFGLIDSVRWSLLLLTFSGPSRHFSSCCTLIQVSIEQMKSILDLVWCSNQWQIMMLAWRFVCESLF